MFHVLLTLVDQERHGDAVMPSVAETTDGALQLGPATLYGTIKRMLDSKLIEESETRPDPELDDERRRCYRLTRLGQSVASAESRRYTGLVRVARVTGLLGVKGAIA